MPLTSLDARCALIVVDLQKGVSSAPFAQPFDEVVKNCSALASQFRDHNLPVVLVNVAGRAPGRTEHVHPARQVNRAADYNDLLPELDRQPQDHVVTKRTWGAFQNTGLEGYLRERGVTQVLITGCTTSAGVESTARQAHELGFNVAIVVDAVADLNAEAHDNSINRIFPLIGETGTAAGIESLFRARDS